MMDRGHGANLARIAGGHTPTLLKDILGFFSDHRESGPRFNVSSEGWCSWQYSVPVATGVRTHTDHRVSTPYWLH